MKIEIGKTYRTRRGDVVTIEEYKESVIGYPYFAYIDDTTYSWNELGEYTTRRVSELDLIEECAPVMVAPEMTNEPPSNLADRYNDGKLEWTLVDFKSLEGLVKVLMFGKQKYGKDNWKKGLKYLSIIDSMLRHTFAFMSGEDSDPESGLPHTDHIMCNAMFLSHMFNNRKDLDDRKG